jgi:hypothetical protein
MKRFFIVVFCVALVTIAYDIFAQDAPQTLEFPTGTMTLSAPEDAERAPTLSPVLFPHSLHFSYACKDCHHTWDGMSAVKGCAASGCHENLWVPKPGTIPLDGRRVKSLAGAYHQVCRDCHRQEVVNQKMAGMDDPVSGPIACKGCHPVPHSVPEYSEDSMAVPLGDMVLEPPEEVEAKRGPVDFPHGLHFQFSCQSCHHEWDGDSYIDTCTSCHDETEPYGTRDIKDPDNVMYYLAAYHNICVGCHRDLEKQAQDQEQQAAKTGQAPENPVISGPTRCDGCHSY